MNLPETGPEVVDWSHLAQIRVKWLALVSNVMGFDFPLRAETCRSVTVLI